MSKRLQVVMSDAEYQALARAARRRGVTIAELVRESVHRSLAEGPERSPEERIAAVLRFARFEGPTGDVDRLLAEIEQGRVAP